MVSADGSPTPDAAKRWLRNGNSSGFGRRELRLETAVLAPVLSLLRDKLLGDKPFTFNSDELETTNDFSSQALELSLLPGYNRSCFIILVSEGRGSDVLFKRNVNSYRERKMGTAREGTAKIESSC